MKKLCTTQRYIKRERERGEDDEETKGEVESQTSVAFLQNPSFLGSCFGKLLTLCAQYPQTLSVQCVHILGSF